MGVDPDSHVLELLSSSNKPFNAQLCADFLQTKGIKKAACQRSLDALVEAGLISCKEFGKSRIYYANQDNLPALSSEETAALTAEVQQAKERVDAASQAMRALEGRLRQLSSLASSDELRAERDALEAETRQAEARVAKIREGGVRVTAEERQAVASKCARMVEHWRRRKGIFKALWDPITENVDGKLSALEDEIGIETDKAVGLDLSEFAALVPSGPSAAKKRRV